VCARVGRRKLRLLEVEVDRAGGGHRAKELVRPHAQAATALLFASALAATTLANAALATARPSPPPLPRRRCRPCTSSHLHVKSFARQGSSPIRKQRGNRPPPAPPPLINHERMPELRKRVNDAGRPPPPPRLVAAALATALATTLATAASVGAFPAAYRTRRRLLNRHAHHHHHHAHARVHTTALACTLVLTRTISQTGVLRLPVAHGAGVADAISLKHSWIRSPPASMPPRPRCRALRRRRHSRRRQCRSHHEMCADVRVRMRDRVRQLRVNASGSVFS
jgi:hypothetical protein